MLLSVTILIFVEIMNYTYLSKLVLFIGTVFGDHSLTESSYYFKH